MLYYSIEAILAMRDKNMEGEYRISDMLWEKIKPLLPPQFPRSKGGRSRMDDRKAMEAVLYIFRTNCKWKELPHSLGASSTVHKRFQEWRRTGVFQRMWKDGLLTYDEMRTMIWHGNPNLKP
jgi:putative transposase